LLFELVDVLICSSQEICEPKGTDGRCFFALTFSGSRLKEPGDASNRRGGYIRGRKDVQYPPGGPGGGWRSAVLSTAAARGLLGIFCAAGLAWGMATIRDKMGHVDYAGPIPLLEVTPAARDRIHKAVPPSCAAATKASRRPSGEIAKL
jgi:hypothetical protein